MNHLKNYTLLVLLTLLLTSYNNSHAHAVVTHSSLNIQAIAPNQPNQLQLTFNAKVELGLSQFFLVSSGDKMQLLVANEGSIPGQIIIDIPALTPGEYALKLKVFAVDGHLSEDLLRFHVTAGSK